MGLFDSLFGSSTSGASGNVSQSETAQTGTQSAITTGATTSNQVQQQNQQQTGLTTSDTTQNQTTGENSLISTLDPQTQALLTSLLPQLTANAAAGTSGTADENVTGDQTIAADLYQKATVGDAAAQAQATAANINAAKLAYTTGEGQQVAGTQQAIGDKGNTYSELIANKGQNDLATQLAQITSSGQLAASGQESADLSAAVQAITGAAGVQSTGVNTAITPLLDIVSALKGANTAATNTTNTTGTTSNVGTSDQQTVAGLISAINGTSTSDQETTSTAGAQTATNATATSSGSATPGLLQTLFSL